jgi:CheY-like chemotaxis protein
VTDINLKGRMDGWEVARQAREIDPQFPVVYMSGASANDWPAKGSAQQYHADQAIRASPTCHRPLKPSQHGRSADSVDLAYFVFGDRKETAPARTGRGRKAMFTF